MRLNRWAPLVLVACGCGGSSGDSPDASVASDAGLDAEVDAAPTTSCVIGASRQGPRAQVRADVAFALDPRQTLTYPRVANTDDQFLITATSDGSDCAIRVDGEEFSPIACEGQVLVLGEELGAGRIELELLVGDGPFGPTSCVANVPVGFPRPCETAALETAHTGFQAVAQIAGNTTRRFLYDEQGLLVTAQTTENGGATIDTAIGYSGERKIVTETIAAENRSRTYTYRADLQLERYEEDIGGDGVDFRMTFNYAVSGMLDNILDEDIAGGNSVRHSYTYNVQTDLPTARTVTVISGEGTVGSTYLYDADGNLTTETRAGVQDAWDYSCFAP